MLTTLGPPRQQRHGPGGTTRTRNRGVNGADNAGTDRALAGSHTMCQVDAAHSHPHMAESDHTGPPSPSISSQFRSASLWVGDLSPDTTEVGSPLTAADAAVGTPCATTRRRCRW